MKYPTTANQDDLDIIEDFRITSWLPVAVFTDGDEREGSFLSGRFIDQPVVDVPSKPKHEPLIPVRIPHKMALFIAAALNSVHCLIDDLENTANKLIAAEDEAGAASLGLEDTQKTLADLYEITKKLIDIIEYPHLYQEHERERWIWDAKAMEERI